MHPLSPGRLPAPPVEEDWNAPSDPLADLEAARELMEPLGCSEAKFLGWTEEYAGGWRQRFIAGIDQPVDGEAVESFSGQPMIRLCDRRIPSEGTE